jgi:hypothetical protein
MIKCNQNCGAVYLSAKMALHTEYRRLDEKREEFFCPFSWSVSYIESTTVAVSKQDF